MTLNQEFHTPQVLQEANTVVKFVSDFVDQLDYLNHTHIAKFEILDSFLGDDWCEARVYFKLVGCPIPFEISMQYLTPEMLTQLAFAADPMDCEDRRNARDFFAQNYLELFITILYGEAQTVMYQAQAQMN